MTLHTFEEPNVSDGPVKMINFPSCVAVLSNLMLLLMGPASAYYIGVYIHQNVPIRFLNGKQPLLVIING